MRGITNVPTSFSTSMQTPPTIAAGSIARNGMRRVGSTHAVQRNSSVLTSSPPMIAELGQRAVAADERQHEEREREEHEPAEQPAEPERAAAEPAAGDAPGLVPRRGERRGEPGAGPEQTDDADDARRHLRVAARSAPRR